MQWSLVRNKTCESPAQTGSSIKCISLPMHRADEGIANYWDIAVRIKNDMRMETKEGNEGISCHITGRKSIRNFKKCDLWKICIVKFKKTNK